MNYGHNRKSCHSVLASFSVVGRFRAIAAKRSQSIIWYNLEMIKNKKFIGTVFLVAAAGLGVFLYVRTNQQKENQKIIQNENVPAENENQTVLPEEENNNQEQIAPVETPKENTTDSAKTNKTPEKQNTNGAIIKKLVDFGFQTSSGRTIDTIIIHSTYNALGGDPFSLDKILDIYKSYGVSPHYIIDRGGKIYQLVEDKNIAYHAGESKMPDGRTGINNFSIGIEMINTKTDKFTGTQYAALDKLIEILKSRYKIKYVLGHNQIAPGRKDDPWNLDPALILDKEARVTLMHH